MADFIVKKASSFTDEEKAVMGITGIPADWPVESLPYEGTVPAGYEQMTDAEIEALKANNQAAYDAWLQSLRPLPQPPAPTEVITLLEKGDKALKLASSTGDFSGDTCVLELPIPGDPGTVARYVAGGYGFTDVYGWGDKVSTVDLVDKDFIYAGSVYPATPIEAGIPGTEGLAWVDVMPTGVVLGSYHDTDVPEANQGWRLWCDDGNQGGVDIDPLGGYGHLYGGAYLRITFLKTGTSTAAHASINVWWGKEETQA